MGGSDLKDTNKIKVFNKKVEPCSNIFGVRLRALIERKGVTQLQFAEEFGLSESQLYNWLKRTEPPLAKHWPKLAEYFGVSTNYLTTGTPEKIEPPRTGHPESFDSKSQNSGESDIGERARRYFEMVMAVAGTDASKLGWVYEQLKEHLSIPRSWTVKSDRHTEFAEIEANIKALRQFRGKPDTDTDSAQSA